MLTGFFTAKSFPVFWSQGNQTTFQLRKNTLASQIQSPALGHVNTDLCIYRRCHLISRYSTTSLFHLTQSANAPLFSLLDIFSPCWRTTLTLDNHSVHLDLCSFQLFGKRYCSNYTINSVWTSRFPFLTSPKRSGEN